MIPKSQRCHLHRLHREWCPSECCVKATLPLLSLMFFSSIKMHVIYELQIILFPGKTSFSSVLIPSLTKVKWGQAFFLQHSQSPHHSLPWDLQDESCHIYCIPVYINCHKSKDFEVISLSQTLIPTLLSPNPTPLPNSPGQSTVPTADQGLPAARSPITSNMSLWST